MINLLLKTLNKYPCEQLCCGMKTVLCQLNRIKAVDTFCPIKHTHAVTLATTSHTYPAQAPSPPLPLAPCLSPLQPRDLCVRYLLPHLRECEVLTSRELKVSGDHDVTVRAVHLILQHNTREHRGRGSGGKLLNWICALNTRRNI